MIQQFAYLPAHILGLFGILFCRNHDIVGSMENLLVAVLYAQSFTASHRVCSYVLAVIPQHVLNIINYAALYTGYVGNDGPAFEVLLIVSYPFLENMRIKGENNHIGLTYEFLVNLRGAFAYDIVFESVLDSLFVCVQCTNFKTFLRQSFGIAAADNSKADD